MPDFPVMFKFKIPVSGNGYLAGVTISGRATMREEDEQWWMHGVSPSGISAPGSTPEEAYLRFQETCKYVLFDFAEESASFETFKTSLDSIFSQRNKIEEECWEEAVKSMRSGNVPSDGYFASLPTVAPEFRPTEHSVIRLDQPDSEFSPADNISGSIMLPYPLAA